MYRMNLTTLDALLIFLVGHKSQSGYDIRQMFQATPLGAFSDSPGSIIASELFIVVIRS